MRADWVDRASYRDLLGTAETVIEMDESMRKAEDFLGGIGQRCNTRMLEKKGGNLSKWDDGARAPGLYPSTFNGSEEAE